MICNSFAQQQGNDTLVVMHHTFDDSALAPEVAGRRLQGRGSGEASSDEDAATEGEVELILQKDQASSPHLDLELGEGLKYVRMVKNELFVSPASAAQEITDPAELELFLKGANTTKLGETSPILLGVDAPTPLQLEAHPEKVVDVETRTSKRLFGFPIDFHDDVRTSVDIRRAPEFGLPRASRATSSILRTDIRFSFEERVTQRLYVGYFDIWSGLGGLLAAILIILSLLSFVCVLRYTWNLSRMIQRKNVHKLRKAEIKRLMMLVPELKRRMASMAGQAGQGRGDLEKASPR